MSRARKTDMPEVSEPQAEYLPLSSEMEIAYHYHPGAEVTLYLGDRLELLKQIQPAGVQLIVTSPPYNIGKKYEKRKSLDEYPRGQRATIAACVPLLRNGGSICWQVGNHMGQDQEVYPLEILPGPS